MTRFRRFLPVLVATQILGCDAGDWDRSFGSNGNVSSGWGSGTRTISGNWDQARAMAIDPWGRILVAGYRWPSRGNEPEAVIWCYDDSGEPDFRFGQRGVWTHPNAAVRAIRNDGSGRYLVLALDTVRRRPILLRLFSNGLPDLSFGGGATELVSAYSAFGDSMTMDGRGRILVAGTARIGIESNLALWRVDSWGRPDPEFGSGFGYLFDRDWIRSEGKSVVIDAGGRILVAGSQGNSLRIWRFSESGRPDESWNITVPYAEPASMLLDGSGRILVTGKVAGSGEFDMALWRFRPDGTPDAEFAGTGGVRHHNAALGFGRDEGRAITIDFAGRILVAGTSQNPRFSNSMAVWRYLQDGRPDLVFGHGSGFILHHGAERLGATGHAIHMDESARIVVAGGSVTESREEDMTIWRLQ